jgi:hypothetical protein
MGRAEEKSFDGWVFICNPIIPSTLRAEVYFKYMTSESNRCFAIYI